MLCKNCNAIVDADAVFCTSCGAKVEKTEIPVVTEAPVAETRAEAPVAETKAEAPVAKKNMSVDKIVGFAVGAVLIIIGLITVFSAGTSISSTAFGADFYTYTYRGIVAISEQLASIQAALGWVVVAIGAAIGTRTFSSK